MFIVVGEMRTFGFHLEGGIKKLKHIEEEKHILLGTSCL